MAFATLVALIVIPTRSIACPACRCGDPSWLLEGPVGGASTSWRAGLVFVGGRTTHGKPSTGQSVEWDRRASLLLARSFGQSATISLTNHYVHRTLDDISGGRTSTYALGDLEIRGQFALVHAAGPRGALTAGLSLAGSLPTGPRLRDDFGTVVDVDAQPGLGAWAGAGGVWADTRAGRWGARATLEVRGATVGWDGHQPPKTMLYSASVRRRIGSSSGLQLGVDGRLADFDRYDGVPDRLSGGHTLFFAPRWSQTLVPGWGVQFGGQIPLVLESEPRSRETGGFEFGFHWGI